jgi:hypothetical protein
MPDNQLVHELFTETDSALLKSLVEVYLSFPSDTPDGHAAALAKYLEKIMQERANANCPD